MELQNSKTGFLRLMTNERSLKQEIEQEKTSRDKKEGQLKVNEIELKQAKTDLQNSESLLQKSEKDLLEIQNHLNLSEIKESKAQEYLIQSQAELKEMAPKLEKSYSEVKDLEAKCEEIKEMSVSLDEFEKLQIALKNTTDQIEQVKKNASNEKMTAVSMMGTQ